MERIVLAAGILLLFISLGIAVWMRGRLVAYTSRIMESLEGMIAGKEELVFNEGTDTLTAKVQVKMRQLYESLQVRAQRLSEEKTELQEIVSDISHQVKTPISNVRMYHQILMNRDLPEAKQTEFLQAADAQVQKLDSLMQSMIKLSRLETGMIDISPKPVRLYPMVQQAVCDIALKAEAKKIDITVNCSEDIRAVCDSKWTLEAIFNLLDNGVKYNRVGGRLDIDVSETDFFVKIAVRDCGRGIEPEHLNQVFQRFYREEDVHEIEGVGLGLFLARKIIENQKGFLDVASSVGEGSVFSIHLPCETPSVT